MQNRAAASFVKAMATRFHSEVCLLHVVEVPAAWYGTPEAGAFDSLLDVSSMLEDRRLALESFLADELAGLSVQRCVQAGDPALRITQYASQRKMDLIMMPTHGYGPFRSLLLGSVTAKVLHDSEFPVWTTAHAADMAGKGDRPWKRILCAVDDDDRDLPLLRWAGELASEQGTELRLVHAVTGFEESPNGSEDPLREFLFGVARERIEKMQAQAGTKAAVSIGADGPGRVVRKIAQEWDADLVLVGRGKIQKHFGRLRSNAYSIVRDVPCPAISV